MSDPRRTWRRAGGFPPERPYEPSQPQHRPGSGGMAAWLQQRLLEERIVVIQGHLDGEVVTTLSAQILTLDATGKAPVRLRVHSPDGDLATVLTLMDALDALVVPVELTVAGEIGGASLGLLACATQRTGQPHARFRLGEPRADATGSAKEVMARTSQHLQMLDTLIVRLAEATGNARHVIEDDLSTGRYLTAEQAKEYGLLDNLASPGSTP